MDEPASNMSLQAEEFLPIVLGGVTIAKVDAK